MHRNLKKGFTLAEVLVALGVIGVIAALAVPSIGHNTQKKQHAIALAKNIEIVESGCNKIIQHANSLSTDGEFFGHFRINKALNGSDTNSSSDSISGNNMLLNTGAFFDTQLIGDTSDEFVNYTASVKAYDGNNPAPAPSNLFQHLAVQTKTGAYIGSQSRTETAASNDPVVSMIYVDVNGMDSPNRYGRDIFAFGLTDACHAIPAGSDRIHAIDSTIPTETSGCNNNTITNGLSCTSRVIKEGYNISY